MVLAALVGAPLGASVGILAGSIVFGKIRRPASPFLEQCDRSADNDPDIPMPDTAHKPVSFFEKALLKDTTPALTNPDYERALFINKILTLLWPHLSPAIHKEVMKQAKAPIDEALAKIPLVEDIRFDKLDLGERPFRVDSFKSYEVFGDQIIMETSMFWGGDMAVRVTAVVKAGGATVDVPVDVSNIQLKALARITVPLVEKLPCAGGVTISLLEEPWVDFTLNIIDSPDIMALPGVPLAVKTAIKLVAGKMLVYPNEFSIPLMENYGLPPPPQGMLKVAVKSGHDLKSSILDTVDPYVTLEIRKGRHVQTSTIANNPNPVWDEELDMVVDNPTTQTLTVQVFDYDLISSDMVGGAVIELNGADFIANPKEKVTLRLPIYAPGEGGVYPTADAEDLAVAVASHEADVAIAALPKKRKFLGKLRRKKNTAAASEAAVPSTPRSPDASSEIAPSEAGDGEEGHVHKKKPPPGSVTGSLTLEVTYFPFKNAIPPPQPEAAVEAAAAEGGEAAEVAAAAAAPDALAPAISMRRTLDLDYGKSMDSKQKGVLTVNLKKVMHLAEATDSYVVLRLYDPHRLPVPDIETKTKVEMNEASPRFNFKTDFVNVSAGSVLTLTVFTQPGTLAALTSLKVPFLQKAAPKALGRVRVPLDEVVREGRMNSVFPLQEAQTGEMHLALEWAAIDLGEDEEAIKEWAAAVADA